MADTYDHDALQSAPHLEADYRALLKRVPWTSPNYLPTDRVPLQAKVAGMGRVADIHNQKLDRIYRPQMRALRKQYAGQRRCFIIGNGPSLNRTDLSKLKGEVTFATNGFYLKGRELDWSPTFYVVEDHLVAEDRADDLNALKNTTKLFPAYLGYCLKEDANTIFFNHRARVSYPHGFDFSTDAEKVTYTGCTVTFTCMQLAAYLGFREIYLIGVDADYSIPDDSEIEETGATRVIDMASDDPNHFHPDYFGKGYRWHDPQVDMMIEAYREARLVCDQISQPIYNATKGGKLEVFERRDYDGLFTPKSAVNGEDSKAVLPGVEAPSLAATHETPYPRVLLIDMVPIGGVSATGALKRTLFSGWPWARLMEVNTDGADALTVDGGAIPETRVPPIYSDPKPLIDLCAAWDPDVIVYRPLDDRPDLHAMAMAVIERTGAPLITWIMDDWLERLAERNKREYRKMLADTAQLAQGAHTNFAISESLRIAMEQRLGAPFHVLANGIDPDIWSAIVRDPPGQGEELVIRYSGGLARDMSRDTVFALAQAVEQLAETRAIRLEINTREHWQREAGALFSQFRATSISTTEHDEQAYFEWLADADVLVVAYNFDEASARYVRHSMGNKIPEVLAAGRCVLAIGPLDYASINHLHRSGGAVIVKEPGVEPILTVLDQFDRARWRLPGVAEAARAFAFQNHDIREEREKLQDALREAAHTRTPPTLPRNFRRLAELVEQGDQTGASTGERSVEGREDHMSRGSVSPPAVTGSGRIGRILSFYRSWRGLLALLAIALVASPGALLVSSLGMMGIVLSVLPAGALAFCFAMIAYLHTVIVDHHNQIEYRIRRVERAGRSGGRRL
ncbi:MAG: DUF115 domain-containing protein [Hyphomonadaceae bacterium]|nr:DUF115 domain-containing protein [Hyphomonadaceae bacterium]